MRALYDTLGKGYADWRRPDPRIQAAIDAALGDAKSVVNVGAGAGSYEPRDRAVAAVEPSQVMIAQRSRGAAPVVQGSASALPFSDKSFDAAMALLTVHHWPDIRAGLREMMRAACKRVVIFTWDVPETPFWLTRDYFPEILEHDRKQFSLAPYREVFARFETRAVPVPHDCSDGFLCAYWRRPRMYLDGGARAAISSFARLGDVSATLARLRRDIDDGSWARRNAELLDRAEMDYGYRLIIAEL
ncbi:MAG: class I SAM-dependent methyltransferase [Alphaproteobacteria bacterium]|nr:class I SAM-dependent methyltransferase [Alphaproteobacteria bacterium]